MGINDDIRSDYDRNHTRNFSEDKINILMSENEVENRLSNGEDPIKLSIEKWEKIYKVFESIGKDTFSYKYYNAFLDFIGEFTCALCISSKLKYIDEHGEIKYQGDKCKMCSLSTVDKCIDANSTYSQVEKGFRFKPFDLSFYTEKDYLEIHMTLEKNILAMIKNLKCL